MLQFVCLVNKMDKTKPFQIQLFNVFHVKLKTKKIKKFNLVLVWPIWAFRLRDILKHVVAPPKNENKNFEN